jgi:hypothetical protein
MWSEESATSSEASYTDCQVIYNSNLRKRIVIVWSRLILTGTDHGVLFVSLTRNFWLSDGTHWFWSLWIINSVCIREIDQIWWECFHSFVPLHVLSTHKPDQRTTPNLCLISFVFYFDVYIYSELKEMWVASYMLQSVLKDQQEIWIRNVVSMRHSLQKKVDLSMCVTHQ